MLKITKCKRCGREIATLTEPIYSSEETMKKWQGICSRCVTDKEAFEMMMDLNKDVRRKSQ